MSLLPRDGYKQNMIPAEHKWFHGTCYVMEFGEDRFLKLPSDYVQSLTLEDIGMPLMRRLIDALAARRVP